MSLETQRLFADALLDRRRAVPRGLTTPNGAALGRRYSVYRDNVASGLVGALASRFPVAEKIVGTAFFAGMAERFIVRHPPRSPVLLHYGDDLAGFVEGFEPAAGVPYLADIIRLEAARGRAYHAPDEAPIDPAAFAKLAAESLADLTVALHPAASIVRSRFPIATIWAMNADEAELKPIENWIGEDALVTRPRLTVRIQCLPRGGAAFLTALAERTSFGSAAASALQAAPDFDLTANIAGMLQAGLVTAIH